ncbi:hypothetical protein [Williamwhitmania taraxaci]|uniref:Uncharacterized protein n=1 Tax=Williamwhitmania taraxaci TaxID=1640674 RepID=A0A1G6UEG8_9BACT|nr:hypothetical protein [Williamwhitmania taraxaci]SDD39768.1 hypothetical protein SAMN05216323_11711 [Williamwhitmania taraxaci]
MDNGDVLIVTETGDTTTIHTDPSGNTVVINSAGDTTAISGDTVTIVDANGNATVVDSKGNVANVANDDATSAAVKMTYPYNKFYIVGYIKDTKELFCSPSPPKEIEEELFTELKNKLLVSSEDVVQCTFNKTGIIFCGRDTYIGVKSVYKKDKKSALFFARMDEGTVVAMHLNNKSVDELPNYRVDELFYGLLCDDKNELKITCKGSQTLRLTVLKGIQLSEYVLKAYVNGVAKDRLYASNGKIGYIDNNEMPLRKGDVLKLYLQKKHITSTVDLTYVQIDNAKWKNTEEKEATEQQYYTYTITGKELIKNNSFKVSAQVGERFITIELYILDISVILCHLFR